MYIIASFELAKVETLQEAIKSASTKLAQTERQLSQGVSSKSPSTAEVSDVQPDESDQSEDNTIASREKQPKEGCGAAADTSSEAWHKFEVLRAQHHALVEDIDTSDAAGGGDTLHEQSLLQAACWQLYNETPSNEKSDKNDVASLELAALELAAITVAVGLTTPSALLQELMRMFDCEVSSCLCALSRVST